MQFKDEASKDRIDFSIFKPIQFPLIQGTWKPVSLSEHKLIRSLKILIATGKLVTVETVFNVQQGIRTGNNEIFKITNNEYSELPENEKKYFRPAIDNDSIYNGKLNTINYVWYPYNKDGLSINTEIEFKQKAPRIYEKFSLYKNILSKRARKNSSNWWILSEHRAWQRTEKIKLISTEFGNSSSFALDLKGKSVVERGYAWQPIKKLSNEDYFFYLSLFSSPFFDKLLSIFSKELAGGKWYDLGKKNTKHIPLPDVNMENIRNNDHYTNMVILGKRLHEGDSYVKAVINDIVSVYYPPIE